MSCIDGYDGQGSGCAACGAPCSADLRAAAAALLAALPRCGRHGCDQPAEWEYADHPSGDGATLCGLHTVDLRRWVELPYAAAVRKLQEVLG